MSNVTITKSSPADYMDNPVVDTRRENTDHATDYRPVATPRDWRYTAVHYAGSGALILVVTLLGAILYFFKCGAPWAAYSAECDRWSLAIGYTPYALLAGAAIFLVYRLFFCVQTARMSVAQKQIENERFSLLPDRFGNPTPADLYAGMTPEARFDSYYRLLELATKLKEHTSQYEIYGSGLNTLSIGGNVSNMAALEAPIEDGIVLTPDDEWRKWLLKAPHLLIGGKTDAGKTTFEQMLLGEYIDAGDQVLILDPHWQPGRWFGLSAISGVSAILSFLPDLLDELNARQEQYKAGKLTEDFDRLTILIDECPAIVDQCIELTASGRPKLIDQRWPRFARKLGSEARKVGVRVILGSQSTQVQDLLINQQMKDNYTRIGLGNQARPLLSQESQAKRKQALHDLLRGQAHPAAMEYRGDYYVLDTSNVVALAERSMRPLARLWDVESAARPISQEAMLASLLAPHNGRVAAPAVRPSGDMRASVKVPENSTVNIGRTDGRLQQSRIKLYLMALAKDGKSREYARQWAEGNGLQFENRLWTEVRRELGLL